VMYGGKLVEQGPVAEVFAAPAHPYTELLMRALPARGRRGLKLDTIPGLVPPATEQMAGCRFANRCPAALPRCAGEPPAATALAGGREVFCHLYADGSGGREALALRDVEAPPPAEP